MMRKITKLETKKIDLPKLKRVAAYARVSVERGRTLHSYSAQVSYYNDLIQKNPEWEFAGVYADLGISGTGIEKRNDFKRLLQDCEEGKIDIILTKSVSRFARNTVDLLKVVRHLKELGIEVRFEKENINSLTGDGELMLSILASFAQEETISISNNVKWGIRKRFEKGIPNGGFIIYGYRWKNKKLEVAPEEAEVVRYIYDNYLQNKAYQKVASELNELGYKAYKGGKFSPSSVREILSNITYTGNLLLQKYYIVDPIIKKEKKNTGELNQYYVENSHEAIISMEQFEAVQKEFERRNKLGQRANQSLHITCFTSKVKCPLCGKSYRRSGKKNRMGKDYTYYVWVCRTKSEKGAKYCGAKVIPEEELKIAACNALGWNEFDSDLFDETIEKVVPIGEDMIEFYPYDGGVIKQEWHSTARQRGWNEERKRTTTEKRLKTLEARKNAKEC
jgi:DNA invertase Pin-like site-specific DNA recombinase